ncbi:MAG: hypothetical protein DBX59_01680, partial [Bacillota bacterium]
MPQIAARCPKPPLRRGGGFPQRNHTCVKDFLLFPAAKHDILMVASVMEVPMKQQYLPAGKIVS